MEYRHEKIAPMFIYLNGFPGVGKLTVAKRLAKLIPLAKVFDNHLIIDPVAAIFERTAPEYQPLRKNLRQQTLHAIATSESARSNVWIFTDQQSTNEIGTAAVMDYWNASLKRGCKFISVILHCNLEENLRRATSPERMASQTTKLTDTTIINTIRDGAIIFRFHNEYELELDVTSLSSEEAAQKIFEHVSTCNATENRLPLQMKTQQNILDGLK